MSLGRARLRVRLRDTPMLIALSAVLVCTRPDRSEAADAADAAVAPPAANRMVQEYLAGDPNVAFKSCDGYGRPTKGADGMTETGVNLLLLARIGDLRRSPTSLGGLGLAACQAALIKLEPMPQHWMRKVSLLRAQAANKLAAGDPAGAMGDLDAADRAAAAPDEPYFRRSLALGNQLLRAAFLWRSGDQAGADRVALAAFESRPYSRLTALLALAAMGPEASYDAQIRIMGRLVQLDPGRTGLYFSKVFESGRFQEAIELYPGLSPPVQLGDEPMQVRQRLLLAQDNRAAAELFWAEATCRKAYALAALGRSAEASATLAEARRRLAAAVESMAPPAPDASASDLTAYAVHEQTNLKIGIDGKKVLDTWTPLIVARIKVGEDKVEAAVADLQAQVHDLPGTWASVELIDAIHARRPAAGDSKAFREALLEQKRRQRGFDIGELFAALPEAETARRAPPFRKGATLLGSEEGYRELPAADPAGRTLKFYTWAGTMAMVEEAALLRTAELATESGASGFMLVGQRNIERTTVNTYYGTPLSTTPAGFEAQLDFIPGSASSNDPTRPSWRWIDAREIQSNLNSLYHLTMVSGSGTK